MWLPRERRLKETTRRPPSGKPFDALAGIIILTAAPRRMSASARLGLARRIGSVGSKLRKRFVRGRDGCVRARSYYGQGRNQEEDFFDWSRVPRNGHGRQWVDDVTQSVGKGAPRTALDHTVILKRGMTNARCRAAQWH